MATDSFEATQDCFHRFRVQTLANVVHAMVDEDRRPRRTHIFLSVVLWHTSKVIHMFHRPLLDMPDHFHHFVTRHFLLHREHCP